MKRGMLFVFALLFVLSIGIVSASECLETSIAKSVYLNKETFQAEITGEFYKDLSYKNFVFYNQDLEKYYYPIFKVIKLSANKYFTYVDLNIPDGSYLFITKDVLCKYNNLVTTVSESNPFLLKNSTNESLLMALNPGVIKTNSGTIATLTLKNKNGKEITAEISSESTPQLKTFVSPNENKAVKIYFPVMYTVNGLKFENLNIKYYLTEDADKINQTNETNVTVTVRQYEVPMIIYTLISEEPQEQQEILIVNDTFEYEEENKSASNESVDINDTLITNKLEFVESSITDSLSGEKIVKINLKNPSNKDITEIRLSYSSKLYGIIDYVKPDYIEKLKPNEMKEIEILFRFDDFFYGTYNGSIIALGYIELKEISTSIPVNIFIKKFGGNENEVSDKTCRERGGEVCGKNETCSVDVVPVNDEECCFGQCGESTTPKKETKINWWLVGVFIGLIVVSIGFIWFSFRKPKKKMEDFVKKVEDRYRQKIGEKRASLRRPIDEEKDLGNR